MTRNYRNKSVIILSWLLTAMTLFAVLFIFSGLISQFNNHRMMKGMDKDMSMPCCYFSGADNVLASLVNSRFILPEQLRFEWLIFAFAAAVILSVVFKNQKFFDTSQLYSYCRQIRDRYGGFKLFEFYLSLFSQGIINPKIF